LGETFHQLVNQVWGSHRRLA